MNLVSVRSLVLSIITAVAVTLVGCGGSTLRIVKEKTPAPPDIAKEVPGIPFYQKVGGCKHQTVWLQPVYTISLTIKTTADLPDSSPSSGSEAPMPSGTTKPTSVPTEAKPKTKKETETYTFTRTLSLKQFRQTGQLRALVDSAKSVNERGAPDALRKITAAWEALPKADYDPFEKTDTEVIADASEAIMASNTISPEAYVDYGTTYYLNSKKPLSGSSQASFKIAEDGTLSEGAAQVETKTLQAFLDLVPFKDVISTIATGALPFGLEGRSSIHPPRVRSKQRTSWS